MIEITLVFRKSDNINLGLRVLYNELLFVIFFLLFSF